MVLSVAILSPRFAADDQCWSAWLTSSLPSFFPFECAVRRRMWDVGFSWDFARGIRNPLKIRSKLHGCRGVVR